MFGLYRRIRNRGSIYRGWSVVTACAAIGAYGGGVYFYGFTLFMNPLMEELEITSMQASLVFSLTRLEGAFEGAIVGFLIDKYGARKIMMIGVPLVGVGYILWATMVHSYTSLIIVYVGIIALGVNGGFFHPALAVANNWFVRRRGTAMAVISTAVGVGGAILVPLVGWGIDNHGWRAVAMVSGIGLLTVVWPLVFTVRHRPEDVGLLPDGDKPNEITSGEIDEDGSTSNHSFVEEVEYTISEAFKTKAMWMLILGITLRFTSHTAVMVHLSPILEAQGMSTTKAGAAIGLLSLIHI